MSTTYHEPNNNWRGSTIGDGIPFFSYFDPDTGLAFEWTGNPLDPIEVAHGGFGEPIIARIESLGWRLKAPGRPTEVLDRFRLRCDYWIEDDYRKEDA
jgi:hypothetical protein